MEAFIYVYEFLTCIVPCGVIALIQKKRHNPDLTGKRIIGLFLFTFYLFIVLNLTGVSTLFNIIHTGVEINPLHINLIPFSDPNLDIVLCVLNIFLFIPLGVLLPFLWPGRNFLHAVLFGFAFSLLIEVAQLFNFRSTDIDDLIMNTLGTAIGYGLYILFCVFWKTKMNSINCGRIVRAEILVLLVFLFHFLTFGEMFAARLIYSF